MIVISIITAYNKPQWNQNYCINNLFQKPMIKACVLGLLFISVSTFKIQSNSCPQHFMSAFASFKNAFQQTDSDAIIDQLASTLNLIPQLLSTCVGNQAALAFEKEVSTQCVADLDKAAKLGIKILDETDNELKTARDVTLLQHLIQAKIKKDCGFLHDLSLSQVKSGGICMESAYKLSLVFEKLKGDLQKGDHQSALNDIDTIVTNLPDTLEACGQSAWAQKVRKYLPMPCVHSFQALFRELSVAEHNYEHLEWLMKHYKEILAAFGDVRSNCPLFK